MRGEERTGVKGGRKLQGPGLRKGKDRQYDLRLRTGGIVKDGLELAVDSVWRVLG